MSYPGTDVIIIAYDCTSQMSLNNVKNKWLPEIKETLSNPDCYMPDPDFWFLLVGTKVTPLPSSSNLPAASTHSICIWQSDLCGDPDCDTTTEMAREVAKATNACSLVETSSKKETNIEEFKAKLIELAFKKAAGDARPSWVRLKMRNAAQLCAHGDV